MEQALLTCCWDSEDNTNYTYLLVLPTLMLLSSEEFLLWLN